MSGGLVQIVAYGAQDIYLTGNPQVTFWKVVYRRHTNFAIESIEQVFTGTADFGNKVQCLISRNGDLISTVMLEVELPALQTEYLTDPVVNSDYDQLTYTNSIGHALIQETTIEIGGQPIDRQYGTWLEIWDELTQTSEKESGFNMMIGKQAADIGLKNQAELNRIYYVPLMFWFNRNPGLALPLIALQYHEVKITITFRPVLECLVALRNDGDRITSGTGGVPGVGFTLSADGRSNIHFQYCQLYVDYVYLDTEERRRFAQESHEYLIDQLQMTGQDSITLNTNNPTIAYRMNFNHPVKELVWVLQRTVNAPTNAGNVAQNDWFNFSTADPGLTEPAPFLGDLMDTRRLSCNIQLNGHDRFSARPSTYFRWVQPWKHHTRTPNKHIYVYSFGLRPEEHQPTGTCNFSRIDNAVLFIRLSDNAHCPAYHATSPYGEVFSSTATGTLTVYARNYNVLRIMSGMAGLAYAN